MVAAAHLRPLEKKDQIQGKFNQPWNTVAHYHQGNNTNKRTDQTPQVCVGACPSYPPL